MAYGLSAILLHSCSMQWRCRDGMSTYLRRSAGMAVQRPRVHWEAWRPMTSSPPSARELGEDCLPLASAAVLSSELPRQQTEAVRDAEEKRTNSKTRPASAEGSDVADRSGEISEGQGYPHVLSGDELCRITFSCGRNSCKLWTECGQEGQAGCLGEREVHDPPPTCGSRSRRRVGCCYREARVYSINRHWLRLQTLLRV